MSNQVSSPPVLTAATLQQEQALSAVTFASEAPATPFQQAFLLFLQRLAVSILPTIGGAYLIVDGWYPLLRDLRSTLNYWEFPGWFSWLFFLALFALGVAFWLFLSYDVWRSIRLVGEWQRLNVYRNGRYRRCEKKGFAYKIPLFESWRKPIDLRIRVYRWQRNLVVTADDYVANPEMAIRYQVNLDEPWRSETEVENFDQLVLTSAESCVPTVGSEFTLRNIQSEKAGSRLKELCQDRVGTLGSILLLNVTDTGIASETQEALNARATLKAQAEGLLEASSREAEIASRNNEAAKAYYPDDELLAGKLAERLRMWQFLIAATGGEGKSTFVLPSLEGLFSSRDVDQVERLVNAFTDKLSQISQKN